MEQVTNILKIAKNKVGKLAEIDFDTSPKNQKNNNRWEFIDGYRGSLALIVVIIHSRVNDKCEIVNITHGYSQSYSIAGFFMLSAFLLTYRLLKDFTKANRDPKQYLLHTLKYFIRRFFRIYLYYILFYTAAKYGPGWIGAVGKANYEVKMSQIMFLGNAGANHLWTIPPEIKYYGFIPVYCMVVSLLGRYSPIVSILSLLWTVLDLHLNIFNISPVDTMGHTANTHHLKSHFSVFFLGSQVALAYFLIEQKESWLRIFKIRIIQIALSFISLAIALKGLKKNMYVLYDTFAFKQKATIYWSICLLLTLLSRPNIISNFFDGNEFLKTLGRHSYSLYLLHLGVVNLILRLGIQYQFEHILVCIVVCYYVSYFFYQVIEDPLIRIANYLCSKLESLLFFSENRKPVADIEMNLDKEPLIDNKTDTN